MLTEKQIRRYSDSSNGGVVDFLEEQYLDEHRKRLKLTKWQISRILKPLFEEITSNGTRRYQLALIELPRKVGKSTLASGMLAHQLLFGELGGELFALAGDRDQARIVGRKVRMVFERNPDLRKLVRIYKDVIECPSTESIFRVLSADADTAFGLNPTTFVVDEFHVVSDRLWESMVTATGARPQPLGIIITTAGYSFDSACYRLHELAVSGKDARLLHYWVSGDEAEKLYIGCHWGQGQAFLDRQKIISGHPSVYQRFHRNEWIGESGAFVTMAQIDECRDQSLTYTSRGIQGINYLLACDLGLKKDRTCIAVVHRHEEEIILDFMRIWRPEDQPNQEVSIAEVKSEIYRCISAFKLHEICLDPWQLKETAQELSQQRIPLHEFSFSGQLGKLSSNLYNLLSAGKLRFPPDTEFENELLRLQVKQRDYGFRLDHTSSGFSDRAIAVGMAALRAFEVLPISPFTLRGDSCKDREWKRLKRCVVRGQGSTLHSECQWCTEYHRILSWAMERGEIDHSVAERENIRRFAAKHKIHRSLGWRYGKGV